MNKTRVRFPYVPQIFIFIKMKYNEIILNNETWLVKVSYKQELDNGKTKTKTESYLFEANSLKDIEDEVKEMFSAMPLDYKILSITNTNIKSLFMKDNN